MFLIKVLAFAAFLASVAWFYSDHSYEPALAIITTLSALIGIWLNERRSRGKSSQTQTVGDGGVGVQSGGDAHVGNISGGGPKDAQ